MSTTSEVVERRGDRTGTSAGGPQGPWSFSPVEMARRRLAFEEVMDRAGVRHAVVYGANRSGSAVPWLTGWPVTREAHVLLTAGEPPVLLVSFFNHVANAARLADGCDVRWAGADPVATLANLLAARAPGPVGLVGALPYDQYLALTAVRGLRGLDSPYGLLRLRKSGEEVEALRRGAALTDLAAEAVARPDALGATEHELCARIEAAYVARGGGHHIHYLSVTSMAAPDRCVPAQWPTDRRLEPGDLMTFELSASSVPDYPGQLLRTFTVAADATALVADLHAAAAAALDAVESLLRPGVLPAELVEAAAVVEAAGFTTVDDLVHGFGGGYLPPILGSASRQLRPPPEEPLEAGMAVVVQPNVVTADHRIGVQTGELLLVTDQGPQRLHTFARGLGRIA